MKNLWNLHARDLLTDQQLLQAGKFAKNPNAFLLAPNFHAFLKAVIIDGESFEAIEKRRGWAARSAKTMLSECLYALESISGTHYETAEVEARERLDYITGPNTDVHALFELKRRFDLTGMEARIYLVLERHIGRAISRECLMRSMYPNPDDAPETKILDVCVCRIRKKLQGQPVRIETVWGLGYMMQQSTADQTEIYSSVHN